MLQYYNGLLRKHLLFSKNLYFHHTHYTKNELIFFNTKLSCLNNFLVQRLANKNSINKKKNHLYVYQALKKLLILQIKSSMIS